MVSSLKTMNQVRKSVGKAEVKPSQVQKAVEKAVSKPEKTQTAQPMTAAEVNPTQESPKKVTTRNKAQPGPGAKGQIKKVNTAETPEDAIMQSEAVTPDLDSAVIPKKQVAKKAAPRTARQASKKK